MAGVSQAKLLPCLPQLFSKTRPPPSYLSFSFKQRNSTRVPRVVSSGFLNQPFKPEPSYRPIIENNLFLYKTEASHKPMFSGTKKFIRSGFVLILSFSLYYIFRKPKSVLAVAARANNSEFMTFLKISASLRAVGFFFLYKTLAFSPPVIIAIIAFSGPVRIILHPLASYFMNSQEPVTDNFSRLLAIKMNMISSVSYVVPFCWIISVICLLYLGYINQETKKKVSSERRHREDKRSLLKNESRNQIKDIPQPQQSNRIRIRITEIELKN